MVYVTITIYDTCITIDDTYITIYRRRIYIINIDDLSPLIHRLSTTSPTAAEVPEIHRAGGLQRRAPPALYTNRDGRMKGTSTSIIAIDNLVLRWTIEIKNGDDKQNNHIVIVMIRLVSWSNNIASCISKEEKLCLMINIIAI